MIGRLLVFSLRDLVHQGLSCTYRHRTNRHRYSALYFCHCPFNGELRISPNASLIRFLITLLLILPDTNYQVLVRTSGTTDKSVQVTIIIIRLCRINDSRVQVKHFSKHFRNRSGRIQYAK